MLVKNAAQEYEDLMGYENLVQNAFPEPQEGPRGRFNSLESDDMDTHDGDNGLSFNDGVGFLGSSPPSDHSEASTVVRRGFEQSHKEDATVANLPDIESQLDTRQPSSTTANAATDFADAMRHAHIIVDNRHAALTRREQQLHNDIRQLNADRIEFEQERTRFQFRTQDLVKRETSLRKAEEELVSRRSQMETSTEPPLARLQAALDAAVDVDPVEALKLIQKFQLNLVQSLHNAKSSVSTGQPTTPPDRLQQIASAGQNSALTAPDSTLLQQSQPTLTTGHTTGESSATVVSTANLPSQPGLESAFGGEIERQSSTDLDVAIHEPSSTVVGSSPTKPGLRRSKSVRFADNDKDKDDTDEGRLSQGTKIHTGSEDVCMSSPQKLDPKEAYRASRDKRTIDKLTPTQPRISPDKKKSKSKSNEGLPRSTSQASLSSATRQPDLKKPTSTGLHRTDSQRSLNPASQPSSTVLHPNDSIRSTGNPSIVRTDSHRDLKTPPTSDNQTLKRSDSRASMNAPTPRPKSGTATGMIRKFSSPKLFLPSRKEKPQPRSSRNGATSVSTNIQHTAIMRIEDVRTEGNETQFWVIRAGLAGSWEPMTRVRSEAPQLVEAFLESRGMALPK